MKAIVLGVIRPLATVRTPKLGSTSVGWATAGAAAKSAVVTAVAASMAARE